MKQSLIISLFLLLGYSCNQIDDTDPKFVIEGFIFAGERVEDIKVKEQIGIDEPDSLDRLIRDAVVVLIKEGQEYPLQYDEGNYKYFGSNLLVESGDLLRLEVTVGDRIASAETIVPAATEGLTISGTELIVPEIILSFGLVNKLAELFFTSRLTASWDNPGEDLHFIAIEPVVAEYDSLFPTGFPQEGKDFLSGFKFAPQALEVDTFSIIGIAFETYGRHRAKVYRVNQEYADLFNNPEQDSRDLTVPPSNVVNGFGIFSAFASDSVFFDIVRE
ncbi:MAG: DUF4249 family protein [Cytophagales bacterium]|nr:DUF4249 family protein [Cytophagales bacterium]